MPSPDILDQLVTILTNARDTNIRCNLLIGAGCSVTAGIPDAEGMLQVIKDRFGFAYSKNSTYNESMAFLTSSERRELISALISNAKLNTAHMAIAQLMANGYIHRVLTPNFDTLLIRALSLTQQYPPVYDLGSYSGKFDLQYIPDKAVFYLHGQYTGFKLMNTTQEITTQAENLAPLFDLLRDEVWLVVGYSGKNDALLQLLEGVKQFEHRLFWVGHEKRPLSPRIQNLLKSERFAFPVMGFNSDTFFWELATRLRSFPPAFMERPFSYLKGLMDNITLINAPDNALVDGVKIEKHISGVLGKAIQEFESGIAQAEYHLNIGMYQDVVEKEDELVKANRRDLLASAYFALAYIAGRGKVAENAHRALELYEKARFHGNTYWSVDNNEGVCCITIYEAEKDPDWLFRGMEHYSSAIRGAKGGLPLNNLLYGMGRAAPLVAGARSTLAKRLAGAGELETHDGGVDPQAVLEWVSSVLGSLRNSGASSKTVAQHRTRLESILRGMAKEVQSIAKTAGQVAATKRKN